jgi:hypothetical protein
MNTVISFSCPAHLALRLNEENIPPREKSAWISQAIRLKLDGVDGDTIQNCSSRRLMAVLMSREDVDDHLKEELLRRLNQSKK